MAKLITVEEIADYLQVTKRTIYRLIRRGDIPFRKVGRQWRFDKDSIDEWLQRSSGEAKASILVIDDEEVIRSLFRETLESLGHRVMVAENGSKGLEMVKQWDFALVFLDLKLPDMNGAEIFRQIKIIKPTLPVIIITGYPESDIVARALAHGPFTIMNKPFGESHIVMAVENFLRINKKRS